MNIEILTLGQKAKAYDDALVRMEKITGEHAPTLGRYLCHLAQKHPQAVGFDELMMILDITKPQVSRITRTLHIITAAGEPGKGLIEVTFDPYNPRLKLVTLNEKGLKELHEALKHFQ